ncbi:MAG: hypothetical protein GXY68_08280 [Chloroflexi bacterium]|nr:hypothetical protein [Chloroflexota bacterium]
MIRSDRTFWLGLMVIVGLYLALGVAYAWRTPLWQAPDEPAHYNYARYIATEGQLPILEPGDYPAAYLEEIKARRFPHDMSIDSLQYEAHQPPAYYAMSAALLRLAGEAPIATQLRLMRLLSLLLGCCAVALLGVLTMRLFASRDLALSATMLAAMTPMFIADTAAANNDALAFAALTAVAVRLAAPASHRWTWPASALLGALVGLCVLSKFQAYVAVPLVAAILLWDVTVSHQLTWRQALQRSAVIVGLAGLLSAAWLARNVAVYGWADVLGLARHDAIVVGQLRTVDMIADAGWQRYLSAYARTTFQSFWGQFGWMAAPLPERVYQPLALVVTIAGVGLLAGRQRVWQTGSAAYKRGVALLAVSGALTTASFAWYNLQFVQFQGRYLFPAMPALSIALACGLVAACRRPGWALALLGLATVALIGTGMMRGDLPLFSIVLCVAVALGLLLMHHLPPRWHWLAPVLVAGALAALNVYSLIAIIPLLRA